MYLHHVQCVLHSYYSYVLVSCAMCTQVHNTRSVHRCALPTLPDCSVATKPQAEDRELSKVPRVCLNWRSYYIPVATLGFRTSYIHCKSTCERNNDY